MSTAAPNGDYYLVVSGEATFGNNAYEQATYDLQVSIQSETVLDFNQGAIAVVDQADDEYQYFRVDVPEDAEGWELRVRDIVTDDDFGEVFFEVRRGSIPGASGSTSCGTFSIANQSGFPEGCLVSGMSDWAGAEFNGGGEVGPQLVLGMNKALEPGAYYVRVSNFSFSPISYTLESRGIGDQCGGNACSIPVSDLAFDGSVAATLPAREVGWYRVTVPEGTPHWTVSLEPEGQGEADLAVRQGGIASRLGSSSSDSTVSVNQAKLVDNIGSDYFYHFADPGDTEITSGVYYIAVVSRGNVRSIAIHWVSMVTTLSSGHSCGRLHWRTPWSGVPFSVLGQSVEFGQIKAYKFRCLRRHRGSKLSSVDQ